MQTIFNNLEKKCDKFEHYFPLYEKWMSQFKNKSPKILEVGVQYGGSAELWHKYFGVGTIVHGVDIDPQCNETDYLKLYCGDQNSVKFWNNFLETNFDIIIDDGSHESPHQILTLMNTYNLLKDGGIYWCEDTHTSYYNHRLGGGYKNPDSFIEYCKNIIDVVNTNHTKFAKKNKKAPGPHVPEEYNNIFDKIQGIHFYDSIVVIEKGLRFPFKRVIHKK